MSTDLKKLSSYEKFTINDNILFKDDVKSFLRIFSSHNKLGNIPKVSLSLFGLDKCIKPIDDEMVSLCYHHYHLVIFWNTGSVY